MGNHKRDNRRVDKSRDPGQFIALPHVVLDSGAYIQLSHSARSLLIEIARQYNRSNNGRLITTLAYLKPRGWNSSDTITRAKRELLAAGFIHETYKGHRPNRASWYALTFYTLDDHPNFDSGAYRAFRRGAYMENASLKPRNGAGSLAIAPSIGAERGQPAPTDGAMSAPKDSQSTPSGGHHLDKPSKSCFGHPTIPLLQNQVESNDAK
jgi:hypothetical protein